MSLASHVGRCVFTCSLCINEGFLTHDYSWITLDPSFTLAPLSHHPISAQDQMQTQHWGGCSGPGVHRDSMGQAQAQTDWQSGCDLYQWHSIGVSSHLVSSPTGQFCFNPNHFPLKICAKGWRLTRRKVQRHERGQLSAPVWMLRNRTVAVSMGTGLCCNLHPPRKPSTPCEVSHSFNLPGSPGTLTLDVLGQANMSI